MGAEDDDAVGGYRLLEEIGRGGFGVVHRALAPSGGLAAVKLLHADAGADPALRAAFAREVEAARRVSPFCVARILDADPGAERPWIASEFIEGPTLTRQVQAEGPRRGADLYRLAVSTATALTAVHQAEVAHRDFKPDNIMMAPDGPRVIDFGIARSFENTSFQATAKVGTLHYMAPERLNDAPILTPAVDVFSWGAVMVYAASGRNAFRGSTATAVITQILTGAPDCSPLPDELRGLVSRCLDKDPQLRPSAHQVLNSLLGSGGGGTDIETALVTGSTAVAAAPPTREFTTLRATAEAAEPKEPKPGPDARSGQLYGFAGGWYRSLDGLAEAFQANGEAACQVFGDPEELASLSAWITEDLGSSAISPDLLRRPEDVELAVLRVVAQARPDLSPVFRGQDVGLAGARALARNCEDPLEHDILLTLDVADVAAGCDCREPDHPCRPGQGCVEYRRMLKSARSAMAHYRQESERYAAALAGAEDDVRTAFDQRADGGRFLQAVLAPDEWRRAVREERAGMEPSMVRYLPPEPPVGTPQPVWASYGLVVLVLRGVLGRLASQRQEMREEIGQRRKYARALRSEGWQLTWIRLLAAGGASPIAVAAYSDDDVVVEGATAVLFAGFIWCIVFLGIFIAIYTFAERMLDSPSIRIGHKYRSVKGRRNKVRQAREDAAQLGRKLNELDAARERLPGIAAQEPGG